MPFVARRTRTKFRFGLVACRSLVLRESSWDLLPLVVLGGAIPTADQGCHEVLTTRWAVTMLAAAMIGAIGAAILVLIR